MKLTRTYCDNCGDPVYESAGTLKPYREFTSLPFAVASAKLGESGVVCEACVALLTNAKLEASRSLTM